MSDKNRPYSISRAIAETLERGAPRTGSEAEFHYQELRSRENNQSLSILGNQRAAGSKTLHVPLTRDLAAGAPSTGGALVGEEKIIDSPLLSWSAAIRAGATVLRGLDKNVSLSRVSALARPEWTPELGFSALSDPAFNSVALGPPKRVSGTIRISKQLLVQITPGTDRMITEDLGRACSSQLDYVCFYGNPTNFPDMPTGIDATAGIHRLDMGQDIPGRWDVINEAIRLVETENISLDSLGFVTSPFVAEALRTGPRWSSGSDRSVWESLPGAISSMVIDTEQIFFGLFSMLAIGIWGDSVDLLINPYTFAATGVTEITANIFCSCVVRMPRAFGTIAIDLGGGGGPLARARSSNAGAQPPPPEVAPSPVSDSPLEVRLQNSGGPKGKNRQN
jgi:Phage capsid family